MGDLTAVKSLVQTALGVTVYTDPIPEGSVYPCALLAEIANTSSRVLSGLKYGKQSTWRVTVYAPNKAGLAPLLDSLELLDNTHNSDFQRIYAQYVLTEQRQPLQVYDRAFYDLTVTPR